MRRPLFAALTSLAVAASTAALGTGAAAAPPPSDPGSSGLAVRSAPTSPHAKVAPSLAGAQGTITAFVELAAPSAVDVAESGGGSAAVDAAEQRIQSLAESVVPEQATARSFAPAPQRMSVTTNLVAGTVVRGDAEQIRALSASPDVVSVYRVTPKTLDTKGTDVFTRALQAWQSTGETGEGVRVGVIDTGVDYTHANFGGPGTLEAYAEAYGEDGAGPIPEGTYDPVKFLGGHDFAGPLYDASLQAPGSTDVPTPDENPIDAPHNAGGGHGSHVAGIGFGYGVDPESETFRGDYGALTDLSDWEIGPGSAPGAGVYALKVFGDVGGSTNLTVDAMEWAADPNGDNDFNDHLDVINLSLGADAAPADDPENLFVDALADLGVLSVFSAGNAGDITDIGGTPGNARSGLTVAWTIGNTQTFDAVEVTEIPDPDLLGTHAAQSSVNYAGGEDVTAPVTYLGDDVSGCSPLTEYADELAGTIAYLWWDDDDSTRECGSTARFNNAEAAGAVGVLLGTELAVFPAGIAGNATIPGAQLTATATDALLEHIQAGEVTMRMGPSFAGAGFQLDESLADTLSTSSSRGVHGSLGIIKPDVAAPGNLISSTASGTGDDAMAISGTSMASPHVAGIAALVRATHPDWTPAQVKADVMNTATHDVYLGANQTGPVFGPARVGSGRVDTLDAVSNTTLAYASEDPDLVSVSFGVVPVEDETVVQRRTVTVRNTGGATARYATSFDAATTTGGATITVTPSSIEVPAGQSRTVTVTLTADPSTLEKELDPTSLPTYNLGADVPREFVSILSGRLLLTSGDTELRVPVQAAPRLVSDLTAEPVTFTEPGSSTAPLTLTGRGVDQGGWTSLVAPMQLMATSPQLEATGDETSDSSVGSGDLRYVGFASTAPQLRAAGQPASRGTIGIGLATQSEWTNLGTTMIPVIDTDVDGDGQAEFQTLVLKYSADVDLTTAQTYTAAGRFIEEIPVNGTFGDVDTTVFDNNVVVAPISLDALGLTEGQTPTFTVWTYSPGYAADPSGVVDQVAPFTVDPYHPEYWFEGGTLDSLLFRATPGTPVTVHRTADTTEEASPLLVLHTHNPTTVSRAQVVDVQAPVSTPTTTTLAVTGEQAVGSELTLTATVAPPEATGTVTFRDGERVLGSAEVADGTASITVRLGGGTHALTASFEPSSTQWAASTSAPVSVEIEQAESSVTLELADGSVDYGDRNRATVRVRATAGSPTGVVEIRSGDTVLATGDVVTDGRTGTVRIDLPRDIAAGSYRLTAVYVGNADVAGSSSESERLRVDALRPDLEVDAPSRVAAGVTPTITVTVSGEDGAPAPTGTVTVLLDSDEVQTVDLPADGTVEVTLPEITRRSVITVRYSGDEGYRSTTETENIRVR